MNHDISVVGAPTSAGAYAPGQEKAPEAFRRHGLIAALEGAGLRVDDRGDAPLCRWRPDLQRPKAMNVGHVEQTARAVADLVEQGLDRSAKLLVLGGDCTVELGTVAGVQRKQGSVGLIYIDLDVDLNTPETSDGALDWTGVAHLLDLPGCAAELTRIGPRKPMLAPEHVLFFAAGEITEPEAATIDRLRLPVMSVQDVKADPLAAARRARAWAASFDRLLIHVDADVLDYTRFPIAENVRRGAGLVFSELAQVLRVMVQAPNFTALTLTEINPDHAPDEPKAFSALIGMLCETMSAACRTEGPARPGS
jgi:arginase